MTAVATAVRTPVWAAQRHVHRAVLTLCRARRRLDVPDAIAITFDDGPEPIHTPRLLDELARLGIPATFFAVGRRADAHPSLIRRMLDEGHAVGSHSYSHPEPWQLPLRALTTDYGRGRESVERAARRPIDLFRPPNGFVDPAGAVAMARLGLRPWLWTIDTGDWEPGIEPDSIVDGVRDLDGGDVLLLHDGIESPVAPAAIDRRATGEALAGISALARHRGLRFVTLA